MRTRTHTEPNGPVFVLREYGWDKSDPAEYKLSTSLPNALYPNSTFTWAVPNGYPSLFETMTDDVGIHGEFHPCEHYTETNTFYADVVPYYTFNAAASAAPSGVITGSDVEFVLGLTPPPPVDMSLMADIAVAYMWPRINEGSSLINFILELKDVKGMVKGSFASIDRLRNRHVALRDLSDPARRQAFIKETTRRMAGAHLTAEFGVVPFVGDVVQMCDELMNLQYKLASLRKYANTHQVRHYKRVLPGILPDIPASTDWVNVVGDSRPWPEFSNDRPGGGARNNINVRSRARWIMRPVYHATMRYTYTLPDGMTEAEEESAALLDTLGVRMDPSIVWNAIPFSFLVDWVVDVSGFLSFFSRDNFPIQVQIRDFCHSVAYHSEHEIYTLAQPAWSMNPKPPYPADYAGDWRQVYKGTRRYYSRELHSPHVGFSDSTKRLKLRQLALSGSLLAANMRGGVIKSLRQRRSLINRAVSAVRPARLKTAFFMRK